MLISLVPIVAIIELLIAAVEAIADRNLDGMRRRRFAGVNAGVAGREGCQGGTVDRHQILRRGCRDSAERFAQRARVGSDSRNCRQRKRGDQQRASQPQVSHALSFAPTIYRQLACSGLIEVKHPCLSVPVADCLLHGETLANSPVSPKLGQLSRRRSRELPPAIVNVFQPILNASLLAMNARPRRRLWRRGGRFGIDRFRTRAAFALAHLLACRHRRRGRAGAGALCRRQRQLAGAASCRCRLSHPRRQRADRLHLADPLGALDGAFRIRHLHLCLDLGAAARRHGRSRPRLGDAALHPRIHRA